jgi:general secretion pathway protein G
MLMRSMEKARARRVSGESGFTLVELLVVIAILGVLAGIVVFAVGGINNNSQTAANNTDCSVLRTAEEAYFAQNNSYVLDISGGDSAQKQLKAGGFLRTTDSKTITAPTAAQIAAGEKDYVISGC